MNSISTLMPTKPKLFLLDAMIVCELHVMGLWRNLTTKTEIFVPRIVAEKECQYWKKEDETSGPIDVLADAQEGLVEVRAASASDFEETRQIFDPSLRDGIHDGEMEALCLLRFWEDEPPEFCTADELAVIGLCLLGKSSLAVSLERILQRVGLGRTVHPKLSQERLGIYIEKGENRFVTGEGLV